VLRYLKWDFSDLFAVNTVRGTAPIAILMKCSDHRMLRQHTSHLPFVSWF
jgi:hypothetical protein